MKLVTYADGRVGFVDRDEIVGLDVPTMREYFERGGADETGERVPAAEARPRTRWTTSAATSSSTTSPPATSSDARCGAASSRSARRSTRSARSVRGS